MSTFSNVWKKIEFVLHLMRRKNLVAELYNRNDDLLLVKSYHVMIENVFTAKSKMNIFCL